MTQVKLKDLYRECKKLMDAGYGERSLVVSCDNEGNQYHGMFYTLLVVDASNKECFDGLIGDSCETDLEKMIIVG